MAEKLDVFDAGPQQFRLGSEGLTVGTVYAKQEGAFACRTGYQWASLFAAAPDLLAALQALADKVDQTSDCDHKRAWCEEVGCIGVQVKAARAAIAKAEGPPIIHRRPAKKKFGPGHYGDWRDNPGNYGE